MRGVDELGDGIYRLNYESLDINIGVIVGAEAVLVIDSRENHRRAGELRNDLRTITDLPVGWVVNTHYHWDHTWGNALFPESQLWGHDRCREQMLTEPEPERQRIIERMPNELQADFEEVVITPPTNTFSETATIGIGNRKVPLSFHGLGHTNSDVVVHIDGVLFAGDLIENGAPPSFGDSYPLAWRPTLDAIEIPDTVVPGHGLVVDPAFVATQAEEIAAVAALAREGYANGAPAASLLDTGPYPAPTMEHAISRAYAQLDHEL